MTSYEVIFRLFALALRIAKNEEMSGYERISEVKGPFSWGLLEHLSELPDGSRSGLVRALIKRRFALEGLQSVETDLSTAEQLAIEHWLKHNNSRHGNRTAPFLALSEHEEMFVTNKSSVILAPTANTRSALRVALMSGTVPINIVHSTRQEIKWRATVGTSLRVDGWVDFGKSGEKASSFLVVCDAERPLHVPTSFLGILGIGHSSWEFLEEGEEKLFSSATIRFFEEVCAAMA